MKKLSLALLAALATAACNKSEETPKYPCEMTFDKIEAVSDMKIYVNGGREIDKEVNGDAFYGFLARRYVVRTETGWTEYLSEFVEPDDTYGANSSIIYLDENDIRYSPIVIGDVERKDDVMILKTESKNNIEQNSIINSWLPKYQYDINLYGYYQYQYIVYEGDNSCDMPLLYYKLVKYDSDRKFKSVAFGTLHNELYQQFVNTLGPFDTLAVKQYILKFSAK